VWEFVPCTGNIENGPKINKKRKVKGGEGGVGVCTGGGCVGLCTTREQDRGLARAANKKPREACARERLHLSRAAASIGRCSLEALPLSQKENPLSRKETR
jgi:hypothetical protein